MKTLKLKMIALLMVMGVITNMAMAQNANNIPKNIVTDFSAKYPGVQVKNWKTDKSHYIASFVMNKRACEATYNTAGKWLNTETTYRNPYKHLSPEIRYTLRNSHFASYHVDKVQDLRLPSADMFLLTVDNNSGNVSAYENAGSVDMETLYFNQSGRLIKSINDNQ